VNDPTIRAAQDSDLDALAAIVEADPNSSWSRRSLAAELGTAWAHVDLVVAGDGSILGFAAFWHVADELQLLYIATHPAHLRRGVARRLLEHMAKRERIGSEALAYGLAELEDFQFYRAGDPPPPPRDLPPLGAPEESDSELDPFEALFMAP
jgi:ribosomal protein S18 acetylase RimI-like enzyme